MVLLIFSCREEAATYVATRPHLAYALRPIRCGRSVRPPLSSEAEQRTDAAAIALGAALLLAEPPSLCAAAVV